MCDFYGTVHQGDLDLEEKILRHFDLSSQYGVCSDALHQDSFCIWPTRSSANICFQPCIGIARVKRWRRANMLKLNPPIEVLAVLLQDENAKERAHMDELLS